MFRQIRNIKRRYSTKSELEKPISISSFHRVAKLYNDLESRLYGFDNTIGTESNLENMKAFLLDENQRIYEELLNMNSYELKIASSIMSKWLFLSDIRANALIATNIQRNNLLSSYEHFDASLANSLNRFHIQRYRNAILNLEKEERNVHGYKMNFQNLSAKSEFVRDLLNRSVRSKQPTSDDSMSKMKQILKANIEQQNILSKIMEEYESKRFARIDKYFELYPELTDAMNSVTRRKKSIHGNPLFDINFTSFRANETKTIFEKFNFENIVDDIISNDDFNVFNVQTIMATNFDEQMQNSFGKTLPEDIKIHFIKLHINHWNDLGIENNLNSIPDDIKHGKSTNWRFYQRPTLFSSDSLTDSCKKWINLIKHQAFDGSSSYFFASNVGRQKMTFQFPELEEHFIKSPYINKEDLIVLSNTTGLTQSQISSWFQTERHRIKLTTNQKQTSEKHKLLEWFERNPFPSKEERQELSESTCLSYDTLTSWFARERKKRRNRGETIVRYLELEQQFEIDPYSKGHHKELALKTGLSVRQVQNWFRRKRVSTNNVSSSKESDFATKYPELLIQFETNPYITQTELNDLVTSTGLAERQIQNWFKYRQKKTNNVVQEFGMASKYPQLTEQFEKNPHPDRSDVSRLIELTGLTKLQIYSWFRNKQKSSGLNGPVFRENGKLTLKEKHPQLENQFKMNPYPSQDEKKTLSEITGLNNSTLDSWFANERKNIGATSKNPVHHKGQSLSEKFPELDNHFKMNPNPTETEKLNLIKATGLTRVQINKYFYNRRKKNA